MQASRRASQAASWFEGQRLIQFENGDKNELVSLVADNLSHKLLRDVWKKKGGAATYSVQIQAVVRLSDFIDAKLAALNFFRQEAEENYRDEMTPPLPDPFSPGLALAKAHWLIRKNELRIAIIYLDRLTQKYPNWREAYDVKATDLGLQNQPDAMREALKRACELDSPSACAKLKLEEKK